MWNALVHAVIRPPRASYSVDRELPPEDFVIAGVHWVREDFEVKNRLGQPLVCSHYLPAQQDGLHQLPCCLYLHGNSGCRADANELVPLLLPLGITVCAFDFSGSGLSGGEYVTLGANEQTDVECIVSHLRHSGRADRVALWGRSMGAATAVLYAKNDPTIAGLVLDSPFSSLAEVMKEVSVKFLSTSNGRIALPQSVARGAIQIIAWSIKKRAGFQIFDLEIAKAAREVFTPAILCHAEQDDFVPLHHSERVRDALAGDKNLVKFSGDHNSDRPKFFYDSAAIFLTTVTNTGNNESNGTLHDNTASAASAAAEEASKSPSCFQSRGPYPRTSLEAQEELDSWSSPFMESEPFDRIARTEDRCRQSMTRKPTAEDWDTILSTRNAEEGARVRRQLKTSAPVDAEENELSQENIAVLLGMGFDELTSKKALRASENDLQRAVEKLVDEYQEGESR